MATIHAIPTLSIPFKEAKREIQGVTASLEKRTLIYLAQRLPASVTSDHLTALGFVATMGIGAAYLLSAAAPGWLHVVNVLLAVNWYGDSLDGTVARVRGCSRPRYGFYVDHVIDAIGAVFVFGGLGASGLMSPGVSAVLLIAYLLAAVHTYLTTYTAGTFKISYGPIGGTELRIILVAANLLALQWPTVELAGLPVRIFDVLGVAMILALGGMLAVQIPRVSMDLRRQDSGY